LNDGITSKTIFLKVGSNEGIDELIVGESVRNHHKMLFGMVLVFTFVLILPMTVAFSETHIFETTEISYTRTIFPEDHRGRIQFVFTANDSLSVQITDADEVLTLWSTINTTGSCDLDVDKNELYRAKFSNIQSHAIYVEYSVTGQGIPGFALLSTIFALLSMIGFIYIKMRRPLLPH
jgi:hypothetical protein